ncbi:MAG: hypothetical protein IJV64_07185 [Oscillospiraceae bacterium]|nr:hypothetical protein [Oscillospiraceae bacterium]
MEHKIKAVYRIRYSTPEKPDGVFYTGAENAVSARLNFLMQTNNPRESICAVDARVGNEWRRVI